MMTDCYIEFGTSSGIYTKAIGNSLTELPAVDPVIGLAMEVSKEFMITGLSAGTRYYYRLRARKNGDTGSYEAGPEYSFMTMRLAGESFNFAFLSDAHVGQQFISDNPAWQTGVITIENAQALQPDFFIIGGDDACTDTTHHIYNAKLSYASVRHFYGPLANRASAFQALGNHDGEASFHAGDTRYVSYQTRKKSFYNPDNTTYEFGSGPKQNYFAWEWGDALFVCLDVFSYTGPDNPKDIEPYGSAWHLGEEQLNWLENVLATSGARWKFLFAHHILASYEKSGYGRGG
jgi:phosphodiesterase/alkaline phosphatase D-like protein